MGIENVDDRITLALNTLKQEMMDLRSQDVQLMKQLLNINTTIKNLTYKSGSKKHSDIKLNQQRRHVRSCILPISSTTEVFNRNSLSVSSLNDSGSYSKSLEGSMCSVDSSDYSESDYDSCPCSPQLSRQPSLSTVKHPDLCDEDLLKTNIRVWKLSKSELSV